MSKTEQLVEEDADNCAIAKTSFLAVSAEAFASIKEQVCSQESDLLSRESAPHGLVKDEFTEALSKLLSAKVKSISSHLKTLADVKRPEDTPES